MCLDCFICKCLNLTIDIRAWLLTLGGGSDARFLVVLDRESYLGSMINMVSMGDLGHSFFCGSEWREIP